MKRVQLTLDEKTITYLRRLVDSGECTSLSHAVRKIVGYYMKEEEKRAGNPTEADVNEEGRPRAPAAARCPACDGELILRRINDLRVVEFQAQCEGCGWSGPLRQLRCGGRHGLKLFE